MKSRTKQGVVMIVGLVGFSAITVSYAAFAYAAGHAGCDIITKCLVRTKHCPHSPGPFRRVPPSPRLAVAP